MEGKRLQEHYPLLQSIGYSVEGKVVLVTGANGGIGRAFVDTFLEHGASKIYAAVRNIQSAESVFQDRIDVLRKNVGDINGVREGIIVPICLDMRDPEAIHDIATFATDVDIVINSAGVLTRTGPLEGETSIENLKYEMDVNVYGFMRLAQAFAPVLEERNGKGIFVQINSAASLRCAAPDVATYSASKAASYSVTQALRQELGSRGVHVVSIHPGPILTDMVANIPAVAAVAPPPSTVAKSLINAITATVISTTSDFSPTIVAPFLIFPDEKASRLGMAYKSFADTVIEQGKVYGDDER